MKKRTFRVVQNWEVRMNCNEKVRWSSCQVCRGTWYHDSFLPVTCHYSPLSTCTLTLATSAFEGLHEYLPESDSSAC